MEPGGGRTAVQNKAAHLRFNLNSGAHWAESAEPLRPLEAVIDEPTRRVSLKGNVLRVTEHFESLKGFEELLLGLYFAIPVLLNVDLADPPIVERVDGQIGDVSFG
jgi:hypothetical protein